MDHYHYNHYHYYLISLSLSPSLVGLQNPPCICLVAFAAMDVECYVVITAPDCPHARLYTNKASCTETKPDKK